MQKPLFRAITTRYKGYAFRSRLEARWAVFFDHLGIRWEYEPEGFELGNGLRYLPDFWLPDWKMWVEVKPDEPDEPTREKACRLARMSGYPVFVSDGMPGSGGHLFAVPVGGAELDGPCEADWGAGDGCYLWLFTESLPPNKECFRQGGVSVITAPPHKRGALSGYRTTSGLSAARSARFEFGQKGTA